MLSLNELSKPVNARQQPVIELIIDNKSIAFQPGQLTILGSRPGMGRTLMMLYIFYHLFKKYNKACYFISNEEEEQTLYTKLMATITQIELTQIDGIREDALYLHPILTSEECFIHNFSESWEELKKHLLEKMEEPGINYLFIDKIQGLYCEQSFRNREQEMSFIVRELKSLASTFQVSVIVSSSLNRGVESRIGKKPTFSDLKDSGTMEDTADMILFLNRPEFYGFTEDEEGNSLRGFAELIIAKNRLGPSDTIRFHFDKKIPCFKPFTELNKFSFSKQFDESKENLMNGNPFKSGSHSPDDTPF